MGMREDFDGILKKFGHNIYLQRILPTTDTEIELRQFRNVLERHTVRHMYPANRGLPGVAQEQMEGSTYTSERIYYFRWDVNPKEGDRIYDETPGALNNQTTWTIDSSLPMRGVAGQIVYWVTGMTRESPN